MNLKTYGKPRGRKKTGATHPDLYQTQLQEAGRRRTARKRNDAFVRATAVQLRDKVKERIAAGRAGAPYTSLKKYSVNPK